MQAWQEAVVVAAVHACGRCSPVLDCCSSVLVGNGVCVQAGEAALSLHGRAAGRLPLALHCLLAESGAAAQLTGCQLAAAQTHILAVQSAVRAFPTLLAPLRSSAHTLSGACSCCPPRAYFAVCSGWGDRREDCRPGFEMAWRGCWRVEGAATPEAGSEGIAAFIGGQINDSVLCEESSPAGPHNL